MLLKKTFRFAASLLVAAGLVGGAQAQEINDDEFADFYGNARAWTVYTISDGAGVGGCRAVRGSSYNDQIMVGYDYASRQWELIVLSSAPLAGEGFIKGAGISYDGYFIDRQVGYDRESNYAYMPMTDDELRRFKAGSTVSLSITGEAQRTWSLAGSTAATLLVQECTNAALGPVFAAVPQRAPVQQAAPAQPQPQVQQQRQVAPVPQATNAVHPAHTIFHAGGVFRHTGNGQWVEEGNDGSRFFFVEYDANTSAIFLNDPSRDIQLALNLEFGEIRYTYGFDTNAWAYLYDIQNWQ